MIEFIKPKITTFMSEDGRKGRVEVEPLSHGYGITVGNSLRRVLLNAIPGIAPTKIRLSGDDGEILHEFSVMPGVKEDVCEIVLNVKEIVVSSGTSFPSEIASRSFPCEAEINVVGPCEVTDAMIVGDNLKALNPSHHIATVEEGHTFRMLITFECGTGYVSQNENRALHGECPIGTIFVDSKYTPVTHVGYTIENARVNDVTNYEKLIMEVETTGVSSAKEVIAYSAGVLTLHFDTFKELDEEGFGGSQMAGEKTDSIQEKLSTSIEALNLSVRSYHCLKRANIHTVEDITKMTADETKELRSLGQKSFDEISDKLKELGFSFRDAD